MALGLGGWAKMYFSRLVPTMGCFFYSFVSFYFSCFGVDVPKDSEQPSRMAIINNSNNGWIIWEKKWEPEDLRFCFTLRAGNKWLGLLPILET